MSNDRNMPCPCGSGKKYKKCCLINSEKMNQDTSIDFFWHQQHKMRNELIHEILEYAVKIYGKIALDEAWDEFQDYPEVETPFDMNSYEIPLFMPWFYYNWTPDYPGSEVIDSVWTRDLPPARSMLMKYQYRLSLLQQQYIEVCLSSPFTFTEVTGVIPGEGFNLKDIFTGEEWSVVEKTASKSVRHGDIIFCKPVNLNNLTTLEATAPFSIPPVYKKHVLDLRKHIEKASKKINKEVLSDFSVELLNLYVDMRKLVMNPEMPKFCNTDGDELVLQKVIFEIENPGNVFEALKDLDILSTEKEILNQAELEKNGDIKKIEFTWAREDHKKNTKLNNTILGHIVIKGNELTAEVNSTKRADFFRSLVENRIQTGIRYKATLITSMETALEESRADKNSKGHLDQEKLLEENPELREHLSQMAAAHWKEWVNTKIPALGNKTPKQAAKTKDGREMLEALLTQFERNTVDHPQPGVTLLIFEDIRKQLKMDNRKL